MQISGSVFFLERWFSKKADRLENEGRAGGQGRMREIRRLAILQELNCKRL